MPNKNHGTFYIPPGPKRCVERKVLNCLARIIANFRPSVGGHLQKLAGRIATLRLLPWQGQPLPLFHTARYALKSYAKINKFVYGDRGYELAEPNDYDDNQNVRKQAYQKKRQHGLTHNSPQIAPAERFQKIIYGLIAANGMDDVAHSMMRLHARGGLPPKQRSANTPSAWMSDATDASPRSICSGAP